MIIIYVLPIQTRMQVDYPKGQSVFITYSNTHAGGLSKRTICFY